MLERKYGTDGAKERIYAITDPCKGALRQMAAKGWKNLDKYRPKTRPDNAGRCRKQVIAVMDDGAWLYFASVSSAAAWIGIRQKNVGRCCRLNQSRRVNHFTGKVNTDHRYLGIRFYFEDDDIWTTKIK